MSLDKIEKLKEIMNNAYSSFLSSRTNETFLQKDYDNFWTNHNELKDKLEQHTLELLSTIERNDFLAKKKRLIEIKTEQETLTKEFYSDRKIKTTESMLAFARQVDKLKKEEENLEFFFMTDIEKKELQAAQDSFRRKTVR